MAGVTNLVAQAHVSGVRSRISDGGRGLKGVFLISRIKISSRNCRLKSSTSGKAQPICFAAKSPEDFSQKGDDEGEFVAPRVTPDYVGKDSIKPPPRIEKSLEGPWITRWGGNVRAGKYQMGQGADRALDLFGNGNAMLVAAGGLLVLFLLLLQFRPDAPAPPPPS